MMVTTILVVVILTCGAVLAIALSADNDNNDVDGTSSLYPNSAPNTFLLNASDIFL
jgi:hypothetical protein